MINTSVVEKMQLKEGKTNVSVSFEIERNSLLWKNLKTVLSLKEKKI